MKYIFVIECALRAALFVFRPDSAMDHRKSINTKHAIHTNP
jgi:hypothetical protein